MLLALDDTDGRDGGCTTHTALQVVAALDSIGVVLRSMPRLVRLNPNCPHKTRGNGAVVLDLALPTGPRVQVGLWDAQAVHAWPEGDEPDDMDAVLDAAWDVVRRVAQPGASPAVVASREALPAPVYWQTVQTEVRRDEALAVLPPTRRGDGRGLIGCAGALAWPGPASSYELIAYRQSSAWGTRRHVDATPLRGLDAEVTFHTWDAAEGTLACVPATACPVLAGLRGMDPAELRDMALPALTAASSEAIAAWMLWATNHASGDHVTAVASTSEAPPWSTVRLPARVIAAPRAQRGGHVHVAAHDGHGEGLLLVAFEPTKGLRDGARGLRPGDGVVATGAWDAEARSVRLESLQLVSASSRKVSNPVHCGKAMKHRGRVGGYRCSHCGAAAAEEAATWQERSAGAWEATVTARRHLHRPLAWQLATAQVMSRPPP